MLILTVVGLVLALIPAWMFHQNLRSYTPPPRPQLSPDRPLPAISVLVPARNEARSIRAAVESALASQQVDLEVIVLDDHSDDDTAEIVRQLAGLDPRLRLEIAPPLPSGWCGKQHACSVLASLAQHDVLVFMDADVRLAPEGLVRMAAFLDRSGAALVSGVPRQVTGTVAERLLIPLIHFLLLGFLPLQRMRASHHPAYGSGCGQLFMARRRAYNQVGGHAAIRSSLHDGLTLPRAFRSADHMTDLFDATEVATCRMYDNVRDVWNGLAKNAAEGLASPRTILPATILLLGGQVMPVALLIGSLLGYGSTGTLVLSSLATALAYYPRFRGLEHFKQSRLGALMHPCGIVFLLVIQWYACGRALFGRPMTWKGRPYQTPHASKQGG